MAVNLLDRELIPITREHAENACSAGYKHCFHRCPVWNFLCLQFLLIVFFTFLISHLVSTLLRLFWRFDTFMDKVLSTGEKCHSFEVICAIFVLTANLTQVAFCE